MTDEPFYETLAEVPFASFDSPDLLDADLDAIYAGWSLLKGPEIRWGLLYPVNQDGWGGAPTAHLAGADWQANLFIKNTTPDFTTETPEDLVPYDSCLISVNTKVTGSVNAARDVGRAAVREAAALLMATTALIAGNSPAWEGAFAFLDNGLIGATTTRRLIRIQAVPPTTLQARLDRLSTSGVLGSAPTLSMSRHWYLRACESTGSLDRFINLWLTAAALYERHRPAGGDRERDGMRNYVLDLATRRRLSPTLRDDLRDRLFRAYELRNRVFHEGTNQIGPADVADLEHAVTLLVRYEAGLAAD